MHLYVKSLQKFGVQLIYVLSWPRRLAVDCSSIENIVTLQTVVKTQKLTILQALLIPMI